MMKKILRNTLVAMTVLSIGVLLILQNYIVVFSGFSSQNDNLTVGVIDGNLSREHSNIINDIELMSGSKDKTHGDLLLEFIKNYDDNVKVYYFDAEVDGIINSSRIIEGLNWMLENDIERVCISLSSTYYSDELQKWLKKNQNVIKVYASYNNVLNSVDYPAQYKAVIGVGSNKEVNYKSQDIQCHTNSIIIINNNMHVYRGNSYLAPLYMMRE